MSMTFSYRYEDINQRQAQVDLSSQNSSTKFRNRNTKSPVNKVGKSIPKQISHVVQEYDLFGPESNGYENIHNVSVKIKKFRWI